MEGKRIKETLEEIENIMDASLFRLIRESLILDDEYCKQLDLCLSNEKKLVNMVPAEKVDWLNYALHNTCRCYLIKTFTYYWLHKIWLAGKDTFLDLYWKDQLDRYLDNQTLPCFGSNPLTPNDF